MDDAAILSVIFSDVEEEEEQDNGDNFVSDTIGKEDTMANSLACAETLKIDLPAKYATDGATTDLKCDLQRQEEDNDCTNTTRRGKRRQH